MRLVIATLTALCLTASAYAKTAGHADLRKDKEKKEKKVHVVLEKVGDRKVQLQYLDNPDCAIVVRIKDDKTGVIFKDVITTDKVFRKNYDLAALADGDYHFEVFDRKHGGLGELDITLGEKKAVSKYFTKVKVIDDKNVALLVKTDSDSKKYVRILDKGHVIFEASFEGDKFGKLFKFEKVDSLEDLVFEVRDEAGYGKYLSAL